MIIAGGLILGEVLALPEVEHVMVLMVVILTGGAVVMNKRDRGRFAGLLFFCLLIGYLRMTQACQAVVPAWDHAQTYYVQGRIKTIAEKQKTLEVRLEKVVLNHHQHLKTDLLVILDPQWEQKDRLKIGMTIKAEGSLSEFAGIRNPGEFDLKAYYHAIGIGARMTGKNPAVIKSSYSYYRQQLFQFRQDSADRLKEAEHSVYQGVFIAALLGDKGALDAEVKEQYQRNGIAHLLAISGLHVSLIGMGIYGLFRKIGMGYGGAGLCSALLMISYGLLTGGTASVFRAVVMFLCSTLAKYLGRSYDLSSSLLLAALLLLWQSPLYLTQVSFQLSFGAVVAIGVIAPQAVKRTGCLRKWQQVLVTGGIVQLFTYPIILYHYFQYPVYSVLINWIAVPLMGYVLISGGGAVLIGIFFPPGASFLIGAGHYVLSFYDWLCRCFEQLPAAVYIGGRPALWQLLGYYLLLGIVFWLLNRKKLTAVMILCFTVLALRPLPITGAEVTFLDVGQGDGMVLRNGTHTVLIDGGSTSTGRLGQQTLEPFFKSKGIAVIDYAFVSHGDQDHISGLEYLLFEVPDIHIKNLVLPLGGVSDEVYQRLIKGMEHGGGTVIWMKQGDCLELSDLTIRCLYAAEGTAAADRNEQSPLLLISCGDINIVSGGDISGRQEALILADQEISGSLNQITVFKASHHGSKFSNTEPWMEQLKPQYTIISCSEDNHYGHPHPESVDRIRRWSGEVKETAKDGAIILQTDGSKIIWKSYAIADQSALDFH